MVTVSLSPKEVSVQVVVIAPVICPMTDLDLFATAVPIVPLTVTLQDMPKFIPLNFN
jgi:hypothetical protein